MLKGCEDVGRRCVGTRGRSRRERGDSEWSPSHRPSYWACNKHETTRRREAIALRDQHDRVLLGSHACFGVCADRAKSYADYGATSSDGINLQSELDLRINCVYDCKRPSLLAATMYIQYSCMFVVCACERCCKGDPISGRPKGRDQTSDWMQEQRPETTGGD